MVIDKRARCSTSFKTLNKRAQLFLLASVIIVSVVISLGITTNQVIVNEEPEDFYDFSDEVKGEIGKVINYEIYSDFEDGVNLNEFVDLLSESIKDTDPGSEFIIIYGDNVTGINVINERDDFIVVNGEKIKGKQEIIVSRICYAGSCEDIKTVVDDFDPEIGEGYISAEEIEGKDTIEIDVGEQIIEFPVSEYKRVLFIIQKEVGYESFIAAG